MFKILHKFFKEVSPYLSFFNIVMFGTPITFSTVSAYFSPLVKIFGTPLTIIIGLSLGMFLIACFLTIKEKIKSNTTNSTKIKSSGRVEDESKNTVKKAEFNKFLGNTLTDTEIISLFNANFDVQKNKLFLHNAKNIGKVILKEDSHTFGNLIINFTNRYRKMHIFIPTATKFFTLRFVLMCYSPYDCAKKVFIKHDNEEIQAPSDNVIRLSKEVLESIGDLHYKIEIMNKDLITLDDRNARGELRIELISVEF
jgi:hypothetical protein